MKNPNSYHGNSHPKRAEAEAMLRQHASVPQVVAATGAPYNTIARYRYSMIAKGVALVWFGGGRIKGSKNRPKLARATVSST